MKEEKKNLLVHIAGVLGGIGATIVVIIVYQFDITFQTQIAFLLAALGVMFGAAGWALKENEAEKQPIEPATRILWTSVSLLILGFGIIPYIKAWGEKLYPGQYVFLVFVIPICCFIVWVSAKSGSSDPREAN